MPSRALIADFVAMVEQGQFVEAMEQYYALNATMQENFLPPRVGLENLLAHERNVLASYKAVHTLPNTMYWVEGDQVVINWRFEFVGHDDRRIVFDELAYQHWAEDKLVAERFYYDPAQFTATASEWLSH